MKFSLDYILLDKGMVGWVLKTNLGNLGPLGSVYKDCTMFKKAKQNYKCNFTIHGS